MTPKEKAVELADTYFEIVKDIDWRKTNSPPIFMAHVKKCVLASVDEILKYILHLMPCNNPECGCKEYWEQVKHEINNL